MKEYLSANVDTLWYFQVFFGIAICFFLLYSNQKDRSREYLEAWFMDEGERVLRGRFRNLCYTTILCNTVR